MSRRVHRSVRGALALLVLGAIFVTGAAAGDDNLPIPGGLVPKGEVQLPARDLPGFPEARLYVRRTPQRSGGIITQLSLYHPPTNRVLGILHYEVANAGTIKIGMVRSDIKQMGIQNCMYRYMLERDPLTSRATNILTSWADTNWEVYQSALRSGARSPLAAGRLTPSARSIEGLSDFRLSVVADDACDVRYVRPPPEADVASRIPLSVLELKPGSGIRYAQSSAPLDLRHVADAFLRGRGAAGWPQVELAVPSPAAGYASVAEAHAGAPLWSTLLPTRGDSTIATARGSLELHGPPSPLTVHRAVVPLRLSPQQIRYPVAPNAASYSTGALHGIEASVKIMEESVQATRRATQATPGGSILLGRARAERQVEQMLGGVPERKKNPWWVWLLTGCE